MLRISCLIVACLAVAFAPANAEPEEANQSSDSVAAVIADHVTDTTMTAMSPLIVISAQGAWEYYQADANVRSTLPWYTSPWLWGSLLGIGALFTVNTVIGNAVPFLKTPMNVVEEHENKITGLLIGLPMVLTKLFPDLQMPSTLNPASAANEGILPIAMSGPMAAGLIAIPIVVACYLMVWLTFHSMHVIALVSPFAIVDTCLKFSRLGLLGTIAVLSFFSPLLAVLLCAAIIAISYFVAGWSLRLLIFGSLLSWDLLLLRHRRLKPGEDDILARGFLCHAMDAAPVRSYGKLTREPDGTFQFQYRPWLVMPSQEVTLSADNLIVQRGIISPTARKRDSENGTTQSLIRFRPEFRGHEEALARHLHAGEVEDHIISRGFRQATGWLQEICSPSVPATPNGA